CFTELYIIAVIRGHRDHRPVIAALDLCRDCDCGGNTARILDGHQIGLGDDLTFGQEVEAGISRLQLPEDLAPFVRRRVRFAPQPCGEGPEEGATWIVGRAWYN